MRNIQFESVDCTGPANDALAQKYGVHSFPHVVMLDSGGAVLYNGGAVIDEDGFAQLINSIHR